MTANLINNVQLRHEYKLENEEGPAHAKLFTVRLQLRDDESYVGTGRSIKKAQQAAATEALKHITLDIPQRQKEGAVLYRRAFVFDFLQPQQPSLHRHHLKMPTLPPTSN